MQLKFTEDILPVTDFRNNAAEILDRLSQSSRPIVLTQRGRASAVLIDVREYQRMCDRLEELERRIAARPGSPAPAPTEPARVDDDLVRELERWIEGERE